MKGPNRLSYVNWGEHVTAKMDLIVQRVDRAAYQSDLGVYGGGKMVSDWVSTSLDVWSMWTYGIQALRPVRGRAELVIFVSADEAFAMEEFWIPVPPGEVSVTHLGRDGGGADIENDRVKLRVRDSRDHVSVFIDLSGFTLEAGAEYNGIILVDGKKLARLSVWVE